MSAPNPAVGVTLGAAVGTAALPDGGRVDFRRLRAERRQRLLATMDAHQLDAVVLGRPANVVYATGARQLWTAGPRPFGPACIVVRGGGRVHLLSTWDEGVPDEIAHQDLFGLSWNPARVVENLRAIEGLAAARRIGTDGLGPGTAQLFGGLAPGSTVVDAGPALSAARRVKTPDELTCIVTALAASEAALSAMTTALRPGVTEAELAGIHAESLAAQGLPTPASEAVACATPRHGPVGLRRMAGRRAVAAGELVALSAGALYAGYEGSVARTRLCPAAPERAPTPLRGAQSEVMERCRSATTAVVAACRAGASGADLQQAWEATGEAAPPEALAWGVGLGAEAPLVGAGCGAHEMIEEGMVLAVQGWVAEEGAGGALMQDVVRVSAAGPQVLSRA